MMAVIAPAVFDTHCDRRLWLRHAAGRGGAWRLRLSGGPGSSTTMASGMLLREGVRVDRAQRALRPMDHLVDILIGGFATAMCVAEGDRCAALLAGVCGGFRQRVSGG